MKFLYKPVSKTQFKIHAHRHYSQPKLVKPKELRGLRPKFSIKYNKNCSCQVFIKGLDVWVKHRDYFSPSIVRPEDSGKPLAHLYEKYMGKKKNQKRTYPDAWGDLLGRCEAWIRLEGLITDIERKVFLLDISAHILRQQERTHQMDEYELEYTYAGNYMVRFWENVVHNIWKWRQNNLG